MSDISRILSRILRSSPTLALPTCLFIINLFLQHGSLPPLFKGWLTTFLDQTQPPIGFDEIVGYIVLDEIPRAVSVRQVLNIILIVADILEYQSSHPVQSSSRPNIAVTAQQSEGRVTSQQIASHRRDLPQPGEWTSQAGSQLRDNDPEGANPVMQLAMDESVTENPNLHASQLAGNPTGVITNTPAEGSATAGAGGPDPGAAQQPQATYPCNWQGCGVFVTANEARNHIREAHLLEASHAPCLWAQCNRDSGMAKESLIRHVMQCHFGLLTVQCPMCHESMSRNDSLKRHMKRAHKVTQQMRASSDATVC